MTRAELLRRNSAQGNRLIGIRAMAKLNYEKMKRNDQTSRVIPYTSYYRSKCKQCASDKQVNYAHSLLQKTGYKAQVIDQSYSDLTNKRNIHVRKWLKDLRMDEISFLISKLKKNI